VVALGAAALAAAVASGGEPAPAPAAGSEGVEAPAQRGSSPEPAAAGGLAAGNALARAGRLEEARAAYLAAWDPRRPDAVLAYNLGVAAHQLGSLPAAVLWYRRALALDPDDAWARANLAAARRRLGLASPPPPGPAATLVAHRRALLAGAALLSWLGAGLLLAPRPRPRLAAAAAAAAAALVGGWLLLGSHGPPELVLLEPCGSLPAGSELWGRRAGAGWRLLGHDEEPCPAAALAPVRD
jgi:tetratricopeptide (TPR) repeat protein